MGCCKCTISHNYSNITIVIICNVIIAGGSGARERRSGWKGRSAGDATATITRSWSKVCSKYANTFTGIFYESHGENIFNGHPSLKLCRRPNQFATDSAAAVRYRVSVVLRLRWPNCAGKESPKSNLQWWHRAGPTPCRLERNPECIPRRNDRQATV